MTERSRGLVLLSRRARAAARRLRTNEVFGRAALFAALPLVYVALGLTLAKLHWVTGPSLRRLALGALVPGLVFAAAILHAALRRRPPLAGALALDRHHDLHDRVTNAIAFGALPAGSRTPLMEAAIADGLSVAERLSPRDAVPLRAPPGIAPLFGLVAGIGAIALLEVPVVRVLPPPPVKQVDAIALSPDDAEFFRDAAEQIEARTTDPEARVGARRFNQLVEDIAERRLDRSEVFRRLDELQRGLTDPEGDGAQAMDEAFDSVARELEKSPLSKPVAKALQEKRLDEAEQALRDLAKKVANAKKDLDKDKLEALRKSMQKASETVKHTDAAAAERNQAEEARKRLLQKKEKQGLSKNEHQELNRLNRQLERLDREKKQKESQQRELSGLDKDLAKAAQDLAKDLDLGSKDMEKGAEDINNASQRQMSRKQKEELKKKLEELREQLRQEGQAGKERMKRMLQFGERARGNGDGQKKDGKGKGKGKGSEGGEGKDGKGDELRLSRGGSRAGGSAVMFGAGEGKMPGEQGGGDPQGGGSGQAGSEWGTGHDPNVSGEASRLKGQTEDVSAAAADTGQGDSASQVIYGAAERGFRGSGYKKVFTDYKTVAEEALAKDEIPPGYRFYVRRYFQLIRPRD